jgi:LacI family transcriptional regulator
MKSKKTSITDIASQLRISKSTVSFVLNGKGNQYNISQKTQQLIREKALELNYVPNFFAKGLRDGKTKTVGLVVADISNPFYAEISKYIQDYLYSEGYSLFVVSTNEDRKTEINLIQNFLYKSVDALIVAPCNPLKALNLVLKDVSIPFVWIDRMDMDFDNFIGIDNYQEAFALIKRFSVKPKAIGIVSPKNAAVSTIQLRTEGIKMACKHAQIPYQVIELEENIVLNLSEFKKTISNENIDSFIALNNKVALGLFQLLNAINISLPQQARLISFDDRMAFSYFTPPITALRQPIDIMAKETAQRVLDLLSGKECVLPHLFLPCSFIERGSH